MLRFAIGTAIFLAALVAIMIRPYRVPEALTALIAGSLMVLGGFVAAITAPRTLGSPAGAHQPMIYAIILGADLGPNLTAIGSLATMLWLLILRGKGLEVTSIQYIKLCL